MPPSSPEHPTPPEAMETLDSPEKERTGVSEGKRIITEVYRSEGFPKSLLGKQEHYSIEMEVPQGVAPEELEFDELTYEGKPVTVGHWRTRDEGHGPHIYQLRRRWIKTHSDCLKHPERFKASWKQRQESQ